MIENPKLFLEEFEELEEVLQMLDARNSELEPVLVDEVAGSEYKMLLDWLAD
ncbi:MAG: hypothetical protein KDK41_11105 [Leptospiraceae bacterium]|nr:hypothetical protein [Leptospiraceae bacterium]MCB1201184.1 hypothetical protein [Leptospiraceae bacterium]